eukprot:GFUD01009887.1.p1 GENE.GFUD01009887.1~~GFUD01009887.1.p1  ORF type:complete len:1025 (-),score=395.46 GFUD01009887.1:142-3216(-)
MTMSLLNAEDLSSLLVFDTLSSDWVREVHMFKSQRRKKEKTFVIFRNFGNKKISSLEGLKEVFDDADFLDTAQFKSGQSHDIVSNKVGANKTARKAAKAWMAEAAKRPTAHQPKVILVPKNINEKALNKEVKLTKVNKNTSDDATLLNVVKAIKPAIPELEKVPVTKSAVATAQVKPSVKETVEVSKAPPIRTESIKNPTQHGAATPIVKPAVPIKTSDAEETRENIQVADAIKPAFAGLPFGSDVKDLEEKPNQTAVTTKEEDTDWKAKDIKQDHTVLKEVKGKLPEFSKPVFASFTAGEAEAWKEDDVGILNEDQKKIKEIPLLLAQPSKPVFAGLPFDDSADAWMDEDIGMMEDADIEEDMIREVKKHSAEIEEIKNPLEDHKHYETDQIETSIKQNVGVIKNPKHNTPLHTITEIENKSVNKKSYMKESKKENKEFVVQTSKTEFTGFHFDDSWMHEDIGIMEDEDDEEDMIREEKKQYKEKYPQIKSKIGEIPNFEGDYPCNKAKEIETSRPLLASLPVGDSEDDLMHQDIGIMDALKENLEQKQNPNKIISCHETGLVEVLQTFLADSENTATGRAAEVASKQVEVKKDEEDSKLGTDLPTFFDIENKSDESDETDGNSDESINDDTDDADLGSKEETKYLKEDFLQNKPDENISGNKKPGHEKFSTEDTCMKVGKTEIEENSLLLGQTSKSAFAGLPIDDSADAWMHDHVGIFDDDEDSEEENVEETIPQYKSGLVEVLQTFLAESENAAAGRAAEAASKQVEVKKDEDDSKLRTDLQTFFDIENKSDESDETDGNSDESLNNDTDDLDLGSLEEAKYLKEDFLLNKPDENKFGIKKPGHNKFSTEDTCMKVGKTKNEENSLLLVQTSKPAFAGLPIDDSADAWMHDDVGIIDDDEDSQEENVNETIPEYKSGLVEVLQTFLAESENSSAGSTSEAASKQVVVKTNEEDSKLGTDLETFFDDEDNDTDESDEPDSNSDESLNYDTDESELGSSESLPDPESDIESTLDSKPKENGLK